jgi:hypothetical protein
MKENYNYSRRRAVYYQNKAAKARINGEKFACYIYINLAMQNRVTLFQF